MSGSRNVRLYLCVLYRLGMLCARFDDRECLLQSTPGSERYALFHMLIVLIAAFAGFIYVCLWPQELYMGIYNDTGNYYELFNIRSFCVGLCLLHICLYIRRQRHIELVQKLLRLHRLCPDAAMERYFRRNFDVYIALAVLCLVNYLNGYARAGLSKVPTLLYIVVYLYSFSAMCLLLVFFVCLQHIVAAGLAKLNSQLVENNSVSNCKHLLYKRHRLLDIVAAELIACFGVLILPIVPLVLFLAPSGPLFLISTVMEGKLKKPFEFTIYCITSSLWNIPWLAMITFMLRSNVITTEANKTAKILAKIPRTGSGVDKMVEKFLLKNLRQQPILTAYGFFALDKSTLFKLFTAIFTYMVILVQFKEMENSTKSLQKS
ncbi:PREDICTED: gustatory and pheromone receptor 39a-like [Drosophila arizonae]|uniref:Gustatory receptor n=1 Tax=Drosophila arizonae TaxID=7263 RepID=A0ABM1NP41_DROAR|nr:PREDICTED: gustatory and pheromone receptor 39a-like [Drosophila arizonae]